MGFFKRKANTKVKVSVEDFEKKDIFLADIKAIVTMEEIPPELVLNWDQIGGLDDKRQITAVFAASLIGDFLPVQLVYQVRVTPHSDFLQNGTSHTPQTTGLTRIQWSDTWRTSLYHTSQRRERSYNLLRIFQHS